MPTPCKFTKTWTPLQLHFKDFVLLGATISRNTLIDYFKHFKLKFHHGFIYNLNFILKIVATWIYQKKTFKLMTICLTHFSPVSHCYISNSNVTLSSSNACLSPSKEFACDLHNNLILYHQLNSSRPANGSNSSFYEQIVKLCCLWSVYIQIRSGAQNFEPISILFWSH